MGLHAMPYTTTISGCVLEATTIRIMKSVHASCSALPFEGGDPFAALAPALTKEAPAKTVTSSLGKALLIDVLCTSVAGLL